LAFDPDYATPGEGCDAGRSRDDSRRRDRLCFSGGSIDALWRPRPIASRFRIDRPPGGRAGRSNLARSTLGLDLFFSGRAFFSEMAAAFSLSRGGGIWSAAFT